MMFWVLYFWGVSRGYFLFVASSAFHVSYQGVCSAHWAVFYLPVDTQHTHPVSELILYPREIQALWSQNYDEDTRTTLYIVMLWRYKERRQKKCHIPRTCDRTGYDRDNIYTHASNPDTGIFEERKIRNNNISTCIYACLVPGTS